VIAARRDWAQAHKDAVMRLTRAFGAAYRFMRERPNRDEMARIAAESTGAPPDVARAVLAFFYEPDRGVMPRQAEIDMAGMSAVIALLGRTGELKAPLAAADRFVDLQYLEAAGLKGRRWWGRPAWPPPPRARFCAQIVPKHAPICA
jgi:ABC-type nitrate/sulfonate/bicarbonate transport system substrate-binding protein